MKNNIFQIQNIFIRRICVIANDFDHAVHLLSEAFSDGMGVRPNDIEFDVVRWNTKEEALLSWALQGKSGFAWNTDEGQTWELFQPRSPL